MLPIWIKPLCVLLLVVVSFGIGWHESSILSDARMAQYQAQIAQAQAQQAQKNAQLQVSQAQVTLQAEQNHEKALTDLHSYYLNLLRQRAPSGSKPVSSLPKPPTSINAVPTDALPLAFQCGKTTQQLEDLQKWITDQANVSTSRTPPSQ